TLLNQTFRVCHFTQRSVIPTVGDRQKAAHVRIVLQCGVVVTVYVFGAGEMNLAARILKLVRVATFYDKLVQVRRHWFVKKRMERIIAVAICVDPKKTPVRVQGRKFVDGVALSPPLVPTFRKRLRIEQNQRGGVGGCVDLEYHRGEI